LQVQLDDGISAAWGPLRGYSALAKEALFSATMLFERIVWLARLIATLLSSSEPVSPK
jgi:hypothetical protein